MVPLLPVPSALSSAPQYEPVRLLEIPRQNIRFICQIGVGNFGEVWKGELRTRLDSYSSDDDDTVQVAIKTLKDDLLSRQKFQHEAEVVSRFKHPNIVELLGVCYTQELQCMVFEYM